MPEHDEELSALMARFRAVIFEWRMAPQEVAGILQVHRDELGLDLVPRIITANVETRIRLLVEIAANVPWAIGETKAWCWLRAPDPQIAEGEATPLELLAGPIQNLRALRALLHCYA